MCKYQAIQIPLFKTNSPHCDSVMAIGATNSFSETSRIVVSRLPKCDSVIFDSTKSLEWINFIKDFWEIVAWDLIRTGYSPLSSDSGHIEYRYSG